MFRREFKIQTVLNVCSEKIKGYKGKKKSMNKMRCLEMDTAVLD